LKIRFSALGMEQIPTTDREKIAKSTDAPAWATVFSPEMCSVHSCTTLYCSAGKKQGRGGCNNKNLMLFIREHAPSTERMYKLSNIPITTSLTTKTAIINVCTATVT
jgi:hypothetical protein